jgi:hypothetical protein
MEYASSRFACTIVDGVVLGVHAKEDPSDADWHQYVSATRDVLESHGSVKVLAYSMGGGPNAVQRTKANELFKDRPQHVAVMLNSALTRGIVTALSWFNPKIRAFNLDQLDDACKYLELPAETAAEIRRMLDHLHAAMKAAAG